MNKNLQNRNKGITLIALVITIIVLLILAGVAINMSINSDGLFGKANEAVEGWNTAVEEERTAIQDLLDELGVKEPIDLPDGWESSKVASVITEGTRKAPIPVGYVVSQITADEEGNGAENTIAGGLVIYQGTDPVIGIAGSEAHNTAMTTRNQFVWIPVDDINQMVMCKSNNSTGTVSATNTTDVCNIVLQANGKLKCETHDSTALCGRLYGTDTTTTDEDTPYIYTTSMNFADRSQTWPTDITSNTSYREPDIVSSYDKEHADTTTYMTAAGITSGKVEDFQTQMTNDFENMAVSVYKYGGFFVSRYETGIDGASKKNQVVLTAGPQLAEDKIAEYQGGNMWYGLYNTAKTSSAINKKAVSTHMIYGSQYDQIINFIGDKAQIGHTDRQTEQQKKTGYEGDKDIMNNIYDLEGNNPEWTAEAYSNDRRVKRGGNFGYVEDLYMYYPASRLLPTYPHGKITNYTTRLSLYL